MELKQVFVTHTASLFLISFKLPVLNFGFIQLISESSCMTMLIYLALVDLSLPSLVGNKVANKIYDTDKTV